uniref:Choline transporter-like protein n=1 Tax=Macrostomum lignano TaxID=282301 RepID=A0A1I8F2T6_9PLAT
RPSVGLASGRGFESFLAWPRHAMLVSCACLCSSATALLWWVFADQKSQLDAKEAVNFPLLDLETQNEDAFLVLSIVSTVLLLVLLFCLCVVCSRARYVGPLFVQAATCLAMDRPSWVSWLWIYHVPVCLDWRVCSGLSAVCSVAVVSAGRLRLVLSDERHSAKWPVAGALADLVWRRLGTVAIGSLVIAVTRLPRWALSWFHKRLRNQKACGGSDACCVRCRRLNKSALAAAALTGEPFWSAAGAASDLLGNKHASLRLAALNSAGDFVLLTAKLALKWSDKSIRFFPLPIVLVATFAFLVAHCFLSVFEFVIDAIFICFSYDLGTNDGSPGREQFMTDDLKQENGAKTAAVDDEAAAHLRLSELEDLDQMEDVPDIALQPQGRRTRLCRCAGCRRRRPVRRLTTTLRSLRTPASTPMRSTGGPADQGSGDNAQPKT